MTIYFDASALVKRYVNELGSAEVAAAFVQATVKATGMASGAEVPAALAKGVRTARLTPTEAGTALQDFWRHWPSFAKVTLDDGVVRRAGELAWRLGLCGYDAIHLASALQVATLTSNAVTVATFDEQLWKAAGQVGLAVMPANLGPFLGRQ